MSVVNDRAEREQATRRIADRDEATLERDLTYWTIAARDHQVEYLELEERQQRVREQYAEAETWGQLIVDELRSRRARARQPEADR